MKNSAEHITQLIQGLPDKTGVYQFFDNNSKLLYVGKAKSLKKRVSSYFNRDKYESGKTKLLVKKIADIKFILVETEFDALLLENTLIKKHQPRFNIQLRDDKTYPWIRITNERFPRVFGTRNLVKDGSEYYGPYASVKMMRTILDLVTRIYKLRNCNYNLSEENIQKRKFRVCLEYHVGNCLGPCEGLQMEEGYNASIDEIRNILKGNLAGVIRELKAMMKEAAEDLKFEKAQLLKEKVEVLEKYQGRSTVVNPSINNVDVFSIVSDAKYAYVNYIKVVNGSIIQGHTVELKKKLEESTVQLLETAIAELRQRFDSNAKEIFVPFTPETVIPGVKFHVPVRGDKKKLLDLSERNARYFKMERRKQLEKTDPERGITRKLEQLQKDLRMKELPRHIECFDNSNTQGASPVAACVVFKNAKPSKKDYRLFNIKTVEGPDDFASMQEVIERRYKRMLEEEQSLPQLIVIDGGKGQLSAALKGLDKLNLRGKISIIGIAKKLEEIYFPGDSLPLYIDKKSESLKIIQHLRNEAHRFGIAHHRKRRGKTAIKSELADINGIGEKTAQKLLADFKSVKRIKEADMEALSGAIGRSKAKVVFEHFAKG